MSLKLIKFLKGDIQISNGLSVKTSLILRHLFEIQPEAIKFFHFMKTFLPRYNKTIEYIEDRFGGYLMELMIIFYFQSQNLMPSIKVLQENTAKEIINGNLKFILDDFYLSVESGWEVQFDGSRKISDYGLTSITSYTDHIPKYFKFYADFDYSSNVMSVYEGKVISKIDYKYQYATLAIYGPIEQDHNIGKKIIDFKVFQFKSLCQVISNSLN